MPEGLNEEQLKRLKAAVETDVATGSYYGAVLGVWRGDSPGWFATVGSADPAGHKPLKLDSVFSVFSITKAFTNLMVFQAIDQGRLALTTPVSQVIPELSGGLRQTVTFYHLLTQSSGLPAVFSLGPGKYIDRFEEVLPQVLALAHCECPPGERVTYSPMIAHVLMAEAVRRLDPRKRTIRQMMADEVFGPLGMKDSALGVRPDLKARHVVPDLRGNVPAQHLGHSDLGPDGAFQEEHAEMPWVGAVSTVPDLMRYARMLRAGGNLDGKRIVSRALLDQATINRTGDKPNELLRQLGHSRGWEQSPAYIGLGFFLRGDVICRHQFGTLASPRTHGHQGAGSGVVWVDPVRDLCFAMLSAGVLHEADNIERFQRLSDMALAAAE
ncbi:MAG: beta-lactamase family protein [Proteobacteria bacterium]|nr:beta-lactamase family protein [Pseudomonadota bacterium]